MSYLLDTHTFIWDLFDHKKLSSTARNIIRDTNNQVFVSIISYWEISLKYSLKKIGLKNVLPDTLPKLAEDTGLDSLSLDTETVSMYYKLPKIAHKDPFDRMLAWQAICKNCILVTKDHEFTLYHNHGLKTVW